MTLREIIDEYLALPREVRANHDKVVCSEPLFSTLTTWKVPVGTVTTDNFMGLQVIHEPLAPRNVLQFANEANELVGELRLRQSSFAAQP